MSSKPHILFIVGSLRKASLNRQLANAAIAAFGDRATCTTLEWADVPAFDQDIEHPAPDAVTRAREEVVKADALWFATPENNHSVPGVLKNLIDWLSRPVSADEPAVITGKIATASTVAGGSCGRYVQSALLPIFEFLQIKTPSTPFTTKCFSREEFTTSELEVDASLESDIARQADALLAYIQKIQNTEQKR